MPDEEQTSYTRFTKNELELVKIAVIAYYPNIQYDSGMKLPSLEERLYFSALNKIETSYNLLKNTNPITNYIP